MSLLKLTFYAAASVAFVSFAKVSDRRADPQMTSFNRQALQTTLLAFSSRTRIDPQNRLSFSPLLTMIPEGEKPGKFIQGMIDGTLKDVQRQIAQQQSIALREMGPTMDFDLRKNASHEQSLLSNLFSAGSSRFIHLHLANGQAGLFFRLYFTAQGFLDSPIVEERAFSLLIPVRDAESIRWLVREAEKKLTPYRSLLEEAMRRPPSQHILQGFENNKPLAVFNTSKENLPKELYGLTFNPWDDHLLRTQA